MTTTHAARAVEGSGRPRIHEQAAAVIALLIVPALWVDFVYGRVFWEIGGARVWILVPLAAAYLLGAVFLSRRSNGRRARAFDLLVAILLNAAIGAASLLFLDLPLSAAVIVIACAGAAVLQILFFVIPVRSGVRLLLIAGVIGAAGGAHLAYALDYLPREGASDLREESIRSNLHGIHARFYQRPVPLPLQTGGALARLWDDYLLATGDGVLYRFSDPDGDGSLRMRRLDLGIPTNPEVFHKAADGLNLQVEWFRVADIETALSGDTVHLFATYHVWNESTRCFTMRLSGVRLSRPELDAPAPEADWSTLFESTPCLPIELPGDGRPHFGGLQIGGRMALIGRDTLLVTVGDHEFDGVTAPIAYSQDSAASYGKIFAIDLKTGSAQLVSTGHRNPQGLFRDNDGVIWSTEHGPRGGDELNRIRRGGNYGWPHVTYGVQYDTFAWPFNTRQGAHDGYEQPVYAWVPSIGVSSLLKVTNSDFNAWKGDLLVGSMRGTALWRMRLDGDRVVVAEAIPLGVRVRDVIEGHTGNIIVWDEQHPGPFLVFLSPGTDNSSGSALFGVCTGCHTIGTGASHGIGPDLAGVAGSPVASKAGYNYSPALRALGGTWTDERLDRFLENPASFAPGTSMRYAGVADARQRQALVQYLKTSRSRR